MHFYKGEIEDISIAAFFLSLAFSIAVNGLTVNALRWFPIAFLLVVPAFVFHELMHKSLAQWLGKPARFMMFKWGIALALLLSPLGFVFAAPGAVFIFSAGLSPVESLLVSSAGPLMNITLAALALPFAKTPLGSAFIQINAFLSLFNLLPFGPLDGYKIFRAHKGVWTLLALSSLGLLLAAF